VRKPIRLDCRAFAPSLKVWFIDEVRKKDRGRVYRFAKKKLKRRPTAKQVEQLEEIRDAAGCANLIDDSHLIVVQIEKGLKGTERTTALSHEALHTACFILKWIGQPPSWDGDEILARLHDHLFEQMLEAR
jgi:hypothetical protein